MKLISLNLWGGRVGEPLLKFVEKHKDTDVFCFQEVFRDAKSHEEVFEYLTNMGDIEPELYKKLATLLPDHLGIFCPIHEDVYGFACFIHKNISVKDSGNILLYENKDFPNESKPDADHSRKMQWVKIESDGKEYMIMNVHGHWVIDSKLDTPERIEQSQRILDFAKKYNISQVLCGDFNLRPNTKSINMLGDVFVDLIKENDIKSTRTKLSSGKEKYADYIFVSKDLDTSNFEVMQDSENVSDHAALMLEFE